MGLRRLFQRKAAAAARSSPSYKTPPDDTHMSSRQNAEDLQAAWDELTDAARQSKVINFHACTRTGRPWVEDPAAVRAIAATLREYPLEEQQDS